MDTTSSRQRGGTHTTGTGEGTHRHGADPGCVLGLSRGRCIGRGRCVASRLAQPSRSRSAGGQLVAEIICEEKIEFSTTDSDGDRVNRTRRQDAGGTAVRW